MQLEPIRIVADWLADESTGYDVNTQLLYVELDGGDTRPNPVTVHDSTRHGWVARKRLSREGLNFALPAMAVLLASQLEMEGTPPTGQHRDGEIQIAIVWVEADEEHASGTAAGLYALRAARRSLYQLNLNDYAVSHRTRGNVYLKNLASMSEGEAGMKWNDAVVTAALVTTWTVRDQAPEPQTS
jgi:hypothetical protein